MEWVNDDITQPTKLANRQIDAVISTMTLHNLRGIGALSNCFQAMRELVGAAGAIYIEDFSRLKSPKSVDYLVSTNGLLPNDKHSELFRASICAAFTLEELRAANSAD